MTSDVVRRPEAIDIRMALRVYAGLAIVAGAGLFLWGPLWIEADVVQGPFDRWALARVFGSLIAAAGCLAVGLALAETPGALKRGLVWFIAAHVIVGGVLLTQWIAIWSPGRLSGLALTAIAAVVAASLYVLATAEGEVRRSTFSMTTLFGARGRSSVDRLRSRYEQQIREVAAQEERNRLARDLHDSVKQEIFAIHTAAATAQARWDTDPPGAREALDRVRLSAREAMTEMEAMLDQLRAVPLEGAGLVEALTRQCEALQFRTGARVEFKHSTLPPNEALAPGAHQALLRVAQEALANIGRHARAKNILVSLEAARGTVSLDIQDDGVGFDAEQRRTGMGIANMQARAEDLGGTLTVASRSVGGTTVHFLVPYATLEDRSVARRQMLWRGGFWALLMVLYLVRTSEMSPIVVTIAAIGVVRYLVGYLKVSRSRVAG